MFLCVSVGEYRKPIPEDTNTKYMDSGDECNMNVNSVKDVHIWIKLNIFHVEEKTFCSLLSFALSLPLAICVVCLFLL